MAACVASTDNELPEVGVTTPKHVVAIKFYSHQLMHFFVQLCISLLSYIKIT